MADDATNMPALEELIGQPGPPPLRIHHLLVATAVTAVLLSVHEIAQQHDVFGFSTFMTSGPGVAYSVATAISVTLVVLGFWWRHHGFAFFGLPGHWLLLQQSLGVGVFVLVAVAGAMRLAGREEDSNVSIGVYMVVVNLALVGMNLWAAWKIADSHAWRWLFVVLGLQMPAIYAFTMSGMSALAEFTIQLAPIATFLLLLTAAMGDRRAGPPRDWPHWFGVFLQFGMYLAVFGQYLWSKW